MNEQSQRSERYDLQFKYKNTKQFKSSSGRIVVQKFYSYYVSLFAKPWNQICF